MRHHDYTIMWYMISIYQKIVVWLYDILMINNDVDHYAGCDELWLWLYDNDHSLFCDL